MPRSEYNTDNTDNTLDGDVFIEITASQRDLAECSLFDDRRLFPANTEAETEDDSYTLNCTGTLTLEDGRVFLRYREPDTEEGEGAQAEISFLEGEPDCVTVSRTGESASAFVIKEAARHTSVYGTPYGALEMCVFAKKVKNSITADEGGELELDYAVELRGLTAQRTKMTVKAKRRKADCSL